MHNAEFVIVTDHKPLKYLLDSPMQNKKIQLWALGISGYNCRIEYIKGTDNSCADLLSRIPQSAGLTQENDTYEPDISDKAYQINALNSNRFDPKEFASSKLPPTETVIKPTLGDDVDMATEQSKDAVIMELKMGLQNEKLPNSIQKRHIVMDNILYFISNADSDPILRLYIPEHLRDFVIKQYHDWNGHMGTDKTYDSMKSKYYWPNMYKAVYDYVGKCVTCQARSLQKHKAPLQETDIPLYAFAKIGLDVSGPYPTSLSGNKYIVGFVDWYSGYPDAFAVPDKSADTIAHLIIEEIFPRYATPLEIVTDNGSENVNRKVKETLEALQKEVAYLNETRNYIVNGLREYRLPHREKRSLIPIVGEAIGWAFGLVTDADLDNIRKNIKNLAANQRGIMHVVHESISILNISRIEIAENRQAVSELIISVTALDKKLETPADNVRKQIYETKNFMALYMKLSLITMEIKDMIQNALLYLKHLKTQLNCLSLGRLIPSTLSPTNLRSLLLEIKSHLPASLALIGDPKSDLWLFYQRLQISAMLYENKIVVIIQIPLLEINHQFDVYQVFNLPIAVPNLENAQSMIAIYQLETEGFMINTAHTK